MFQLSRNKTEIEIEITGIFSVNEKLSEKNKESIGIKKQLLSMI